ncbi:restriction endonuclease subunit S [Azospira sp. I09]|uniref:restriction endonuclease subunit S n=1 Tax=Azospira sp. I09 TaxID=1765049 RepID=UPI0012604AB9|nr:restriction endonuclease subunit S [Azospira sp. I09]BBN89365.1 type I site-specific deoxyribonuclease specificity subunit [Azospira sp. I09]
MVKEGKKAVVPKLRFPGFRDAWDKKALAPYLEECGSRVPATTSLPIYSSSRSGLTPQASYYDGRTIINDGEYGVVPPNCFVYRHMSDDGQFAFNVNETGGEIAVSKEYPVFRTINLDSRFLRAKLNHSQDFKAFALSQKAGGTRTRLYFSKLGSWETYLPSLVEQQKIADCLSSLDELIASQGRKVEALKTYKRGLMQQLFPREGETLPRLRFPEFRDAPEWEEQTLRSICIRIMDGTHFSPKSKEGPRPYLTSKNIRNGHIDLSTISYISEDEHREIYTRCPVKKDDILLTKDGANTGNCAINTLDFEFSLLSSVAVLRGDAALVKQNFLYQTITSERTQSNIINSMSGQAITRITLEKLGNFVVSLPNLAEQQRIAQFLSFFDTQIMAEADKFAALNLQKKGLLQQLFPSMGEA